MARKKAQALPHPEPEMLTIYGDILQETEDAILLDCEGENYWLPKSQIEYSGERGDEYVEVNIPDWLTEEKGLFDRQGYLPPATVAAADVTDEQQETLASIPTADTDTDDEGEPSASTNAPDILTCPLNLHKLGKELITVTQELTDAERLELAGKMADALQRRDMLEEEFASVKKSYKDKIDLTVEDAATAGSEYRSGERTHTLMCEKYEDKSTLEIVYLEPITGREISRRKMTDDDRRLKLPMDAPIAFIGTTEPTPDTTRTCVTCTHMAQDTDEMPEPCQTCIQCDNGDADNWEPEKECPTCANSTTRVNLYPCAGCCRNAADDHQGDDDRWELKEVENVAATQDVLEQDATAEAEDMPPAEADAPTTEDSVDHDEDMPAMPLPSPDVMPDVMPDVRQ